jgi:hypothetical protein
MFLFKYYKYNKVDVFWAVWFLLKCINMDGWAAGANNTAQLSQENKLKLDEIQCTIYVDWT